MSGPEQSGRQRHACDLSIGCTALAFKLIGQLRCPSHDDRTEVAHRAATPKAAITDHVAL
jgi:hypothetical protein